MSLKILPLTLFIIFLAGCNPSAIQSPTPQIVRTCTVEGCGITLSVDLTDNVPKDYILEAVTPSGEKMSVHCVDGTGQYADDHFQRQSYPVCKQNGVEFLRFSPDKVTMTIRWGDQQASQTFQPNYQSEWPNGPDCEPECRVGQVTFQVPEN